MNKMQRLELYLRARLSARHSLSAELKYRRFRYKAPGFAIRRPVLITTTTRSNI